ncbi:MAG: aminodeoxychorismate lyase [Gammaproteobacteria bacterium]|nr:aminodeoxychorismate lyase [Gammaproteobacteria bacterium]
MLVNGSDQDSITGNDRGLAYGDGVFETIRLHNNKPLLLGSHLNRLALGAQRLQISLNLEHLEQELEQLTFEYPAQGILKILVTRGRGGRGYRPPAEADTTRLLTLHPLPDYAGTEKGINVFVCNQRLAKQPSLAGIKHLNRLEQVMASLEWPGAEFHEGLMLDTSDFVVEGTRSNIFWGEKDRLFTPALDNCGVEGVMRNYLLEKIPEAEPIENCTLDRLLDAEEIFFCNSIFGIWPVLKIKTDTDMFSLEPNTNTSGFTRKAKDIFAHLLESAG